MHRIKIKTVWYKQRFCSEFICFNHKTFIQHHVVTAGGMCSPFSLERKQERKMVGMERDNLFTLVRGIMLTLGQHVNQPIRFEGLQFVTFKLN